MDTTTETKTVETVQEPKKKKSIVFPVIIGAMLIGGGIYGYNTYRHSQGHEETDDAQIATNMAPVISKIPGYIKEVKVTDNQFVHKGDTLLVLDNRDQQIALEQAKAALGTARSNVETARATTQATSTNINTTNAAVQTATAQIEAAKVNVWKANQDLKRYANLVKDHSITQQQYDQALAAKQLADRQLEVLVDQRNQAAQQTSVINSQTTASSQQIGVAASVVKQREVDVKNAELNLSYTVITAPQDGYVSKVPVQIGQYIQPGAQLFSLIRNEKVWVVANFKETQLAKMAENQRVEIKIDAFPKQTFEGYVSSFSPGTGSSFSVLPPDNASGNFVKVVQRVPVRIDFKNLDPAIAKRLRAGMNVKAEVELQ